jgi:acetylornithine deacetylase/succinyl-diaminopimelate desuccinylase-like protein
MTMKTNFVDQMLELAIQIQQVPAPTHNEYLRAEFVKQKFIEEAGSVLTQIQVDFAGNVLACLPGKGNGQPLVISAHMDTVFPLETPLAYTRSQGKIFGPGIGDNSLGVAALFGVLWSLRERGIQTDGDIWFVANVCEEGLGDLRGMKALVERFGSTPIVYLVLEGMSLGHIYHKAIGVRRYLISIRTGGGHSWADFGKPSAVHELAGLIDGITSIQPAAHPHTTYNVGRIGGGTSINTIAAEAWMELDLRSEGREALDQLYSQVMSLVESRRREGVDLEMKPIGWRPPGEISVDHPIIRLAESCLYEQGLLPVMTMGSTDANVPLSQGYPALVLGLTRGGGAHTINEYIETGQVDLGLEHIVQFVSRLWN